MAAKITIPQAIVEEWCNEKGIRTSFIGLEWLSTIFFTFLIFRLLINSLPKFATSFFVVAVARCFWPIPLMKCMLNYEVCF